MKNNDINNLIERLQGFDGEELQREMTDGLDDWCRRRRQRERNVKRGVLIALLLLTTTAIAMTAIPWLRSALQSSSPTDAPSPTPASGSTPTLSVAAQEVTADSTNARPSAPQPVDYY